MTEQKPAPSAPKQEQKPSTPITKKALAGILAVLLVGSAATGASYYFASRASYVAKVNGEVIPLKEFNRLYVQQKKQAQITDEQSDENKKRLASMRQNIIDRLVERQLILQEAKRQEIQISDEEIQKKVDEVFKTNFGGDQEKLDKALRENGMSKSDLTVMIAERETLERTYKAITDKNKPSAEEMKKFYDQNRLMMFSDPEQMQAWHILVKDEATSKKVMAEIKAGKKWDALAKQYSQDPGSKDQGGDLNFFPKGRMVKEFEAASWSLKPNEISNPVKSQFGYHIIKGGEHKAARIKPFEEVKTQIDGQLGNQRRNEAFGKWMEAERAKAEIVVKDEYQAPAAEASKPAPLASAKP